MRTFKRIVAVLVMVLSILTIIALVVGIVGSWVVNAQLRVAGTELLLTGESSITAVRQGLGTADGMLSSSLATLGEIQTRAEQIGAVAGDNGQIVDAVLQRLNADVAPTLERATERFNAVEANLVAINDAVAAIDAIPMLRISVSDMPGVSLISDTLDKLEQIRADVRTFVDQVTAQREQIITGAKAIILDPAVDLSGRLQNIAARMTDADARLADLSTQLADVRERLPRILNTITIVLNIFFLWSIVAFISLFLHALQYYKCPDDGLGGLLPPEPCASDRLPPTVIKPAGK